MYAFFLLHRNSQCPGAVNNLTCLEAAKVEHYEIKGDAFAVVKVPDHKTSATYGEVKLVMDKEVVTWFLAFRDVIRPQRGSLGPAEPLSVTVNGGKVTNLSNDVTYLASDLNEGRILNPTAARKATATIAAGLANDVQRRLVATQMGHSSRTADMYYTSLGEDSQRIQAYQAMSDLRQKRLDSESEDSEPETLTLPKKRARVKFTEEEGILQEFFKDSGKSSLSEARKFLELHPEMNRIPKQIQDKVKQLLLNC